MSDEKPIKFQAFDGIDRPSLSIANDCVHCGFCLSACPTYLQTGNELDSPRGRIYLMKSALEGRIPMGGGLVKYLDLCLGCLGCETACPSGVDYSALVEMSKAQIERKHRRPLGERIFRAMLFCIFPYAKRLKAMLPALWLYQASGARGLIQRCGILSKISGKLARMEGMMPEVKGASLFAGLPEVTAPKGRRRYRVGMLAGCVQSVLFPQTNEATVRVLAESGCEVVIPKNQGCCGALSLHSGRLDEARGFARANIKLFDKADFDAVIVNAAGCGSTMKEYGHLFAEDAVFAQRAERVANKTKDVMEFLADVGLRGNLKEVKMRATYQDACHIAHGQRIKSQPRAVIRQIPGVELIELGESDVCCGSAGIYNLTQPEMAEGLLERKLENLERTKAEALLAGNPGCLLQIKKGIKERGLSIETLHPIELVDRAYGGKR
ncbi:MAG: (Fe-S)-binding protein [Deltaproteobacteria bacterium]